MPRVNGIYQLPPGSHGVPDTTILSNKYNTVLDDLAADANAARPIGAGGTGATSVSGARAALGLANAALTNVANTWTAAQAIAVNNGALVLPQGANLATSAQIKGGATSSAGAFGSYADTNGLRRHHVLENPSGVVAFASTQGSSYILEIDDANAIPDSSFVVEIDGAVRMALDAAGNLTAGGSPVAKVYTGSAASNTDFPIGHTLIADNLGGSNATLNASYTVRVPGTASYEINGGSGSVLTGTWRCRGTGGPRTGSAYNTVLMQRVS